MKPSTKDEAEGKFHKVKGTIKEAAGKLSDNPKLEAGGKVEKIAINATVSGSVVFIFQLAAIQYSIGF
jgi:uncharacterized protein YjbJ (UPF0337 family)